MAETAIFLGAGASKAEGAPLQGELFFGYSFPDADIHIKYLLKRAQTNRTGQLKVTVVNGHPGKDPELEKLERQRYERFLGSAVDYTALSFGKFAEDPSAILR